MNELMQILPKVRKEIYFNNFQFSKSMLETVIIASSQTERLVFDSCFFSVKGGFDFSGINYKTKYISFYNSKNEEVFNKWSKHPERFENIIKAISECGLSKSLETIDVKESGIEVPQAKAILAKHGVGHIEVVEEINGPIVE
jgi:hypothetical protein